MLYSTVELNLVDLARWYGVGGGREVQKGGHTGIHTADSLHYTIATNTTL